METTDIADFARRDGITDALTDLLRTGAQQLIATAVEAELAGYLAQSTDVCTEAGHAAVVRKMASSGPPIPNRYWPCERTHSEGALHGWHTGDIPICLRATLRAPHQDLGRRYALAIQKGISSGEMGAALKVLLGPDAAG